MDGQGVSVGVVVKVEAGFGLWVVCMVVVIAVAGAVKLAVK